MIGQQDKGKRESLSKDTQIPGVGGCLRLYYNPGLNSDSGSLADPRGCQGREPPLGPLSIIFMQFSTKIVLYNRLAHNLGN